MIDGCGQSPGINNRGYSNTIPNQLWHTSAAFDFVQGTWARQFKGATLMDRAEVRAFAEKHGATTGEIAAQLAGVEKVNALPRDEFEATHTRQVIYLKPVNAWIITDRATRNDGRPARSLTQLWHFPAPHLGKSRGYGAKYGQASPLSPGFEIDQVKTDASAGQVLTANPENVNLAILHAASGAVNYALHFGEKYPHRGWANMSPSMVSGYIPAVDLEATFPAGAPIVTVLIPIPQGQTYVQRVAAFTRNSADGQTRIDLRMTDGTEIAYAVSKDDTELTAGPAHAKTEALLSMTQAGQSQGLAVTCRGDSYTFIVTGGKVRRTANITAPSAFAWKETPAGLVPAYADSPATDSK